MKMKEKLEVILFITLFTASISPRPAASFHRKHSPSQFQSDHRVNKNQCWVLHKIFTTRNDLGGPFLKPTNESHGWKTSTATS